MAATSSVFIVSTSRQHTHAHIPTSLCMHFFGKHHLRSHTCSCLFFFVFFFCSRPRFQDLPVLLASNTQRRRRIMPCVPTAVRGGACRVRTTHRCGAHGVRLPASCFIHSHLLPVLEFSCSLCATLRLYARQHHVHRLIRHRGRTLCTLPTVRCPCLC